MHRAHAVARRSAAAGGGDAAGVSSKARRPNAAGTRRISVTRVATACAGSLSSLPTRKPPRRRRPATLAAAAAADGVPPPPQLVAERAPPLLAVGSAFYRAESAQARDLAILAASVRRRELEEDDGEDGDDVDEGRRQRRRPRPQRRRLRVLDVMCGSGGRGARYLAQAGACEVWSNDFNPKNLPTVAYNLACAGLGLPGPSGAGDLPPSPSAAEVQARGRGMLEEAATWRVPGLTAPAREWRRGGGGGGDEGEGGGAVVARATCADAARLLAALGLAAGASAAAASSSSSSGQDDEAEPPSSPSPPSPQQLFELVDLDSFGSADTHLVALALGCVAYGGLLFLTSTDGFVSSGKRPERALAAYGAWTRPLPTGAPEQGLRALIGHAAREAAAQGLSVEPLFSYYSFHGPVFRVMLRVTRGGNGRRRRQRGRGGKGGKEDGGGGDDKDDEDEDEADAAARRQKTHARRGFDSSLYGFVGHCREHGETGAVAWPDLGRGAAAFCPACARAEGGGGGGGVAAADVAGPMWLGPLHDPAFVDAMTAEAQRRGWIGGGGEGKDGIGGANDNDDDQALALVRAAERDAKAYYTGRVSRTNPQLPLDELLSVMGEEAAAGPHLPPLYLSSKFLGRRLGRCPPRDGLIAALRARGWAAARCQLERRALRTDAPMEEVARVAGEVFEGCGGGGGGGGAKGG